MKLTVYSDTDSEKVEFKTDDNGVIAERLQSVGIRFERWKVVDILPVDATDEDVRRAYKEDIDRIKKVGPYVTDDVARITSINGTASLREKFNRAHWHPTDEVRFIVEGEGAFYFHAMGQVHMLRCERGDYIGIPAHHEHWFDMGADPHVTALRFYNELDWTAEYTDFNAQRFPIYEKAV